MSKASIKFDNFLSRSKYRNVVASVRSDVESQNKYDERDNISSVGDAYSGSGKDLFNQVLSRTKAKDNIAVKSNIVEGHKFSNSNGGTFDIYMMGLVIVMGGQMYGWNAALSVGFGSYAVGQSIIGIAYVILVMCLSEIASAVAFSGGAYGLSRVVLGFFPGFLIGSLEMIEYTMMTSASVTYIASVVVDSDYLNWDPNYQPIIWFITLLLAVYCCISGRRFMWTVSAVLASFSLAIISIYCIGSLPHVSFRNYAPLYPDNTDDGSSFNNTSSGFNETNTRMLQNSPFEKSSLWFVGGMTEFMAIIPYCTWAYAGVEALTLLTSETATPTKTIPKGMIAAVLTLFTTNIFLVFVASSLPPGLSDTQSADFVMNAGLHYIFKCSDMVSSTLILPGQFAMAWGFVLPCAKLIHSMAQSNLMPSILHLRDTKTHVPSMIAGCTLSFLFCGLGLAVPEFAAVSQNIAILSATITYIAQLFCYYMLRTKFSSVEREFRSPVGIPGAVFSGLAFILCFIATAFFQDDGYVAFYSLAIIVAICSAYYYLCARNTQVFSEHEHGTVFRLHVINFNTRKQRLKDKLNSRPPIRLFAQSKASRSFKDGLTSKVHPAGNATSSNLRIEHHYSDNSNSSSNNVEEEERNVVEEPIHVESYRGESKQNSLFVRDITEAESLSYKNGNELL